MGVRELAVGAVITVFIGGTAYTISQSDIVDNFANDTGISQQEAQEFVDSIEEEGLSSFDEVGEGLIEEGNDTIAYGESIDCEDYEYEWQSSNLSCERGKAQLIEIGQDEISLGNAYIKMEEAESEAETRRTIADAMRKIDKLNTSYEYEIMYAVLTTTEVEDAKNRNSYNKALLQTVLDSL